MVLCHAKPVFIYEFYKNKVVDLLYSNVSIINTALHTLKFVKKLDFMLWIFYHNF